MKRYFFLYLLSLFILLVSALLLWPTRWINLDIGSFHYHKLWLGPNLSDITDKTFEREFNFNLGFDFSGGSEYTLYAFAPTGSPSLDDIQKSVDLLKKRLELVGYGEGRVTYKSEKDTYLVSVQIPDEVKTFESIQYILSQTGDVQVWSQRATPLEVEGEGSNSINDYLKSNFEDTGIRIRSIKGVRLKDTEDGYALYIGLNEQDSSEFTEKVYSLYGKSIIVVIDEGGGYPIDGSVLGEELQYYQSVKTIQIVGFSEKQEALAVASLIQFGPLPVNLIQTETKSLAPQLGVEFVRTEIFALGAAYIALALISLIIFKSDGIVANITAFWHFISILVVFKIAQTTLTIGGMMAFLLSVIVFWVLISILLFTDRDNRRMNFNAPLSNSVIANTMKALIPITILYVCILVLGGGQLQKYISEAVIISVSTLWINCVFSLRFVYRLFIYIKEIVT